MKKRKLRLLLGMLLLAGVFYPWTPLICAEGEKAPMIHVDQSSHTFPTVYEGKELSHTFTLSNRGSADLEIKKVTHS